MLYATGWQPYSVRIGDTWYSYARLEPLGLLLGIAADMKENASNIDEAIADGKVKPAEVDKIASMLTFSVAENLADGFLRSDQGRS